MVYMSDGSHDQDAKPGTADWSTGHYWNFSHGGISQGRNGDAETDYQLKNEAIDRQ
jgi:hypothetical protein